MKAKANPRSQTKQPLGRVLRLHADHPLVGTWVVAGDDSSIEFRVKAVRGGFAVAAADSCDGEKFIVSDVRWDGEVLRFAVLVPSNETRAEHCFRVRRDGSIEDRFTAQYTDTLVRKSAPAPGRDR